MARTKGMLNLSGNLEVNAQAPLDARTIVPTLADLTASGNFPYPYIGLEVYVIGNGKKYRLIDLDTTDDASWEEIGSGGSGGSAELENDVTANTTVGAIASGQTLTQGTTFTEFVQKLKTIAWYEGNTLLQTDTVDSTTTGSWTYTMGTATTDSTTFKAIVTYTKSDDTDTSVTKTSSISFYYNKFYGGVSDLNPSEATVEALTSALATGKGGTYSFTVSAGRICYAYPKSLGALTSIKDGNGFSLFDSFTRTEQTYTQAGNSVVYYRYVLTDATTVSGYSVTFA